VKERRGRKRERKKGKKGKGDCTKALKQTACFS
jgi:hypothetical protein